MPYQLPNLAVTGAVIESAWGNQNRDNWARSCPGVVTAAGDLTYADVANSMARLPIGTAGQILKVNSGETAPEWVSLDTGVPSSVGTANAEGSSGAFARQDHVHDIANGAIDAAAIIADNIITSAKLTNSGATAGTYGDDAYTHPSVTVDAKGRVTAIFEAATTGIGSDGTSLRTSGTAGAGTASAIIGTPTGSFPGSGGLNTIGNIFLNGSQYANPDYALELWATGVIERFKENLGAAEYPGLRSLEDVEAFAREHFQLPHVWQRNQTDDPCGVGVIERHDAVLEMIEELFIHLFGMNRAIKAQAAEIAGLKAQIAR